MTDPQIHLLLTCVTIIVSIIAIVVAGKARSAANKFRGDTLKLSQAQVEMGIRSQVNEAKHRIEDFLLTHGDFLAKTEKGGTKITKTEKERADRLKLIGNGRVEGHLNALDEACQKYNDDKVDKVRFQKAWQTEIRQAVKEKSHNEFLQPGHTYHALMGVYDEWENKEKG